MKKLIPLVLSTIMLLSTTLSLSASAENSTNSEKDYGISYNDLFLKYPFYLRNTTSEQIIQNATDAYSAVIANYDENDELISALKSGASEGLDVIIKNIGSALGLTDSYYDECMDKATLAFMQEVYSDSDSIADLAFVKESAKQFKWIKTATDLSTATIDIAASNMKNLSKKDVEEITKTIKGNYGKVLDPASDLVDIAKYAYTACVIEDVQIELIDLLMEKSDSSSELYKGLNRLRSDMKNGIAQYTLSAFIENKLLSEISSEIMKVGWNALDISTGSLVIGKLVMKTAVWVLFDVIFPHPDADEVISNMILTMYVNEISVVLTNQRAVFNSPFFVSDMEDYEILYNMYLSCINATMDSTMKLAETTGDETALTEAKNDFNTSLPNYNTYIEYCIKEVFSVSVNDRIIRQANPDECIIIPSGKVAVIGTAPEDLVYGYDIPLTSKGKTMWGITVQGTLYSFQKSIINGDLYIPYSGGMTMNADVEIDGDLYIQSNSNMGVSSTLDIKDNTLIVWGNCENEANLKMEYDNAHVIIYGDYTQRSISTSVNIIAGTLEIKGDMDYCGRYKPSGTHKTVLSGDKMQNVEMYGGSAGTGYFNILEITNTSEDGVCFSDTAKVYKGLYSNGAKIVNGNNVYVCDTTEIRGGVWNADLSAMGWTCGSDCKITGDLYIPYNGGLTMDADIEVCGNLYIQGHQSYTVPILNIKDNTMVVRGNCENEANLKMEDDDARLVVYGNYKQYAYYSTSDNITAGVLEIKGNVTKCGRYKPSGTHKTILSGDKMQNVEMYGGSAGTGYFNVLEITNTSEEGVCFTDNTNVSLDILQPTGTKITNGSYVKLQNKTAFVDYAELNSQINIYNSNAENVIPTWLDYERYCKFAIDGDKAFTLNEAITDTAFTCDLYFSNDYSKTSAVVIVAFYDGDNRFVQMASKPVDVKAGKIDCSIEFEDKDYSKCKVMIWESFENLIPLSSVYEF